MLARAESVGLDALAITDHDTPAGSLEAIELAPEYDIIALGGIEVSSADGHVLAIGVTEAIPRGLPFAETVRLIQDAGGIAIAAHPYQRLRRGLLANIEPDELAIVDAIETYNARFVTGRTNRQAATLARRLDLPITAGSDAHSAAMVGQAITRVDADPDATAIIEAIRAGKTGIDGRRTPLGFTLRKAAETARRRTQRRLNR